MLWNFPHKPTCCRHHCFWRNTEKWRRSWFEDPFRNWIMICLFLYTKLFLNSLRLCMWHGHHTLRVIYLIAMHSIQQLLTSGGQEWICRSKLTTWHHVSAYLPSPTKCYAGLLCLRWQFPECSSHPLCHMVDALLLRQRNVFAIHLQVTEVPKRPCVAIWYHGGVSESLGLRSFPLIWSQRSSLPCRQLLQCSSCCSHSRDCGPRMEPGRVRATKPFPVDVFCFHCWLYQMTSSRLLGQISNQPGFAGFLWTLHQPFLNRRHLRTLVEVRMQCRLEWLCFLGRWEWTHKSGSCRCQLSLDGLRIYISIWVQLTIWSFMESFGNLMFGQDMSLACKPQGGSFGG